MSDSESVASNEWSALTTVTDFDIGFNSVSTLDSLDIVPVTNEANKHMGNSVFVESLIDQLCKLLVQDATEQKKLYNLLCSKLFELRLVGETYHVEELASLRSHYQEALVTLTTAAPHIDLSLGLQLSRYHTEYEELGYVASGGFGKVYRARHRLDGVVYAIKKIPIRSQNQVTFKKRLKEVKTLAQLNHPNIVQYKAAWLEPLHVHTSQSRQLELSVVSRDSSSSSDHGVIFTDSRVSREVVVNRTGSRSSSSPDEAQRDMVVVRSEAQRLSLCHYQQYQATTAQRSLMREESALLYVSMHLCDGTVRQWLDTRNAISKSSLDLPLAMNIFSQVTKGLEYIHACGIVHHDIKPSNIFLSSDLKSVQLGDFGLSCCFHGHSATDPCPLEDGQTGTLMYAAPEQLKGHCTPQSDLFSLGLVLVELVTVFSTAMERAVVLDKLKAGLPPRGLPFWLLPLVKELTASNPDLRPTATELLRKLDRLRAKRLRRSRTKVFSVDNTSSQMDSKDREIAELKRQLSEKDSEIEELKRRLSETSQDSVIP